MSRLTRWLHLLETLGPLILLATPLAGIAPLVLMGIKTAESIPGATGAQKKALVQQIVGMGAQGAGLDPQMASDTAGAAIDAVVGVINVAHTFTHAEPDSPPS